MPEVDGLVDHLFRHQAGRMISTLTRIFGPKNLDLAEDVLQEAMIEALRQWPFRGVPENPGAWLIQVARNRALDLIRRQNRFRHRQEQIERSIRDISPSPQQGDPAFAKELRDDQLKMVFTCCHPAVPENCRTALTLKMLGGFGVAEIARAFLIQEKTVAQRLVRAKRRIQEEKVPFVVPGPEKLPSRLDSVLEVLYLMFNEGHDAHQGDALIRKDLCYEAIRLCELLTQHPLTVSPKVHALAALFLFQAARLPARVDSEGDLLLLSEQNRSLWNKEMIQRGFYHLDSAAEGDELTEYHLQAEIAACHVIPERYESTDWHRILYLYDLLLKVNPSPVVALNRAVAVWKVEGPRAGFRELEVIKSQPALKNYYPLYATLGELCSEVGKHRQAARCYEEALKLDLNEPVRRFLSEKLAVAEAHIAPGKACC